MGAPHLVWHGIEEFKTGVVKLDEAVIAAAKQASQVAGAELAVAAKATAPHKSGDLAASIAVAPRTVSHTPIVQVGPTIVYGRRVELGFKGRKSPRGVKKRRAAGVDTGRRGLQPTKKNPFLAHALEASRPRIAEIYRRAWANAISRS